MLFLMDFKEKHQFSYFTCFRNALSVMVIVGNGIYDQSSNPQRGCVSLHANALVKVMNPPVLITAVDK